ncbi:TraR/DksA C4-type zinc finger protein [Aliiroseovarius sp. F20344]|uniref:TraR/DksA family transcriptional regulator n=1 Tax=Aliiroseovarius sp. F20344 TaxID=2926414 RepID=UPI001FF52941|nr:TraR/DksA C4-type zinc finger protein [Aliiroseovarius sp. F20344]MCK0143414.1 TraR/DksA C4-type zinc finger protein [Aliiroseovarius sp. F20344]
MEKIAKMNESQIAQFKALLLAKLEELDQDDALGQDGQKIVELDQQAVGRLSRMDALQNQAMAKATGARRSAQRQRVLMALERINEDEFGYCEDCGEDIALGRLELDPTAPKCVSCASG